MRMKPPKIITVVAFLFAGMAPPRIEFAATSWRSGRMISATLSGYGSTSYRSEKLVSKTDIWWNYCIASEGQFYTVVSREKPEKLGLTKDKTVRFSERKDRIYVINPAGKRVTLRIVRKDKTRDCP
jgi:hypothetical protein